MSTLKVVMSKDDLAAAIIAWVNRTHPLPDGGRVEAEVEFEGGIKVSWTRTVRHVCGAISDDLESVCFADEGHAGEHVAQSKIGIYRCRFPAHEHPAVHEMAVLDDSTASTSTPTGG